MRAAIVTLALLVSTNTAAQEVTSFRSGLICLNPNWGMTVGGGSQVCVETVNIVVTGQSQCTFNKKKEPCTWYGFEFEFDESLAGKKIKCEASTDVPSTLGDPRNINKRDVSRFEYELRLPKSGGKFFNPQYAIFNAENGTQRSYEERTTCRYKDTELFSYRFRFDFPVMRPIQKTGELN